jgi:hypothetical protein
MRGALGTSSPERAADTGAGASTLRGSGEAPPGMRGLATFSLGVGARAYLQDNTNATVQGAVRVLKTGRRAFSSLSVRPAFLLPALSCSRCSLEYRLSGTVDFYQSGLASVYFGAGAAINKDRSSGFGGRNFAMLSGGAELNIARHFAVSGVLHLIDESSDPTFGGLTWADAEASLLLTVRF